MNGIKDDFPVLKRNPDLIYFDSACTALKPRQVIDAQASYYNEFAACGGRSSHKLGRETDEKLYQARTNVANFVGAHDSELIWTKNTTEGLNTVINGLDFSKKRKVVTTVMEHHAVLLPLMRLRESGIIELKIIDADDSGIVSEENWKDAIDRNTALIVTHSWNNVTGTGQEIEKITKLVHDKGALIAIDGAQGVPHHKTSFKKSGVDFLCFSGHKMLGPTGIGALVCKKEYLKKLRALVSGGGTVKTVTLEKTEYVEDQTRFEAGIQNYAGIFGFDAACVYLQKIGMERIQDHEKKLSVALYDQLMDAGVEVYGPQNHALHGALYSFNFKGAKAHDVTLMLDKENIALRSGFFCAQPAMERIGARNGASRASCYIYNTEEDIRKLGEALYKIKSIY